MLWPLLGPWWFGPSRQGAVGVVSECQVEDPVSFFFLSVGSFFAGGLDLSAWVVGWLVWDWWSVQLAGHHSSFIPFLWVGQEADDDVGS